MEQVLIRVKDACDRYAIGRTLIYQLIAAKKIEAVRIGSGTRGTRIVVASLDSYVKKLLAEQTWEVR